MPPVPAPCTGLCVWTGMPIGMPDDWEIAHGLNPWVNDADIDADKDGLTNMRKNTSWALIRSTPTATETAS